LTTNRLPSAVRLSPYSAVIESDSFDSLSTELIIKAPVLLISGCQDNQYSADGAFNGLFTSQLLTVWKEVFLEVAIKNFINK
jgi:hypothetical protein